MLSSLREQQQQQQQREQQQQQREQQQQQQQQREQQQQQQQQREQQRREQREQQQPDEQQEVEQEELDYVLYMDSNNHFVDWGMFWRNIPGKKEKTFCGSLYDLERRITSDEKIRSVKYAVISVGVNDVDILSAQEVQKQLEKVVNVIDFKYGQPKIVIGELTPRMDDRDEEVIKCNQLIKEYTEANDRLFLAKQEKLRTQDGRHYHDTKPITKYAVPIFISSLKTALRAARGIEQHQQQQDRARPYNSRGHTFGGGRGRGGYGDDGGYWGRGGGRGGVQRGGGRGGRGGVRGGGRGRGGLNGGFDFRDEFEKFKTEVRNIIANTV